MAKITIINADDYGLTSSVSKGIRHAFLNGILTSTSVMPSGLTIEQDLPLLLEDCPGIGIGVHLTLTNFKSISNPKTIKSLVNQQGNFYSLSERLRKKNEISPAELYMEWKSQIERILSFGAVIDHLDSHHYASYISKETLQITLRLSKEFNLPIRTPYSPDNNLELENESRRILATCGIKYPNKVFTKLTTNQGTQEFLDGILNSVENGCTEISLHPGYIDEDLRNISSYVEPRSVELNILLSSASKKGVIKNGLRLSTFRAAFSQDQNLAIAFLKKLY